MPVQRALPPSNLSVEPGCNRHSSQHQDCPEQFQIQGQWAAAESSQTSTGKEDTPWFCGWCNYKQNLEFWVLAAICSWSLPAEHISYDPASCSSSHMLRYPSDDRELLSIFGLHKSSYATVYAPLLWQTDLDLALAIFVKCSVTTRTSSHWLAESSVDQKSMQTSSRGSVIMMFSNGAWPSGSGVLLITHQRQHFTYSLTSFYRPYQNYLCQAQNRVCCWPWCPAWSWTPFNTMVLTASGTTYR